MISYQVRALWYSEYDSKSVIICPAGIQTSPTGLKFASDALRPCIDPTPANDWPGAGKSSAGPRYMTGRVPWILEYARYQSERRTMSTMTGRLPTGALAVTKKTPVVDKIRDPFN